MTKLAFLGPAGTWSETVALIYQELHPESDWQLCPHTTIPQVLKSVAIGECSLAIVPVENSVEGSVTTTLDGMWQWEELQIHQAIILPIRHALISCATTIQNVQVVYSHRQALSQCEQWLEQHLAHAHRIATHSTTDMLPQVQQDAKVAVIASPRAASLHNLPVLACPINDYGDNCTCFWVLAREPSPHPGKKTSLAFSVLDRPGSLVAALELFALQGINLSRIESRPSKRGLGEYIFFVDVEASLQDRGMQITLKALQKITETLKVFGSYDIIQVQ
ncbi:MAG: prephenate dehydratase [Pseudanabaenaceae cyanobacterium SKYGB_i_bin29]|nr:prephenate dehydratase [Pseudanabaenaceae cyanobacterium SKYG29]MDW8420563.1 prephenate dehydratase [Pseudanabaenaceae cyanobacterium SKYGB_i_bin29]